jgi:hypothetical protein
MKKHVVTLFILALSGLICMPPPLASAYEEMDVADGGVIKGTVTFKGAVPMRKIIPTKDPEVCGGVRDEPQIIVAGDRVIDAIAYLKEVPKGKKWAKPTKTPELNNRKCRFEPNVQVIPAGMNVAILNSDPVLHNTHGFLIRSTVFNVAMPKPGMRVERPLRKPGLIRVECDSHGWMRAWILVADNPYYAVTGKDGIFTIPEVPPGNYTLVVWQEHAGSREIPVAVKSRETVTVPTIELK